MKNYNNPWAAKESNWNTSKNKNWNFNNDIWDKNKWLDSENSVSNMNVGENEKPELVDGYWAIKENGQIKQTNILDYNQSLYIYIKTKNILPFETVNIGIYEKDPHKESMLPLEFLENKAVDSNGDIFFELKDLSNLIMDRFEYGEVELYFKVEYKANGHLKKSIFPVNEKNYLRLFIVRFVPEIMKSKGWSKGAELQEMWFKGEYVRFPWRRHPFLELIKMDWALEFNEVKEGMDILFKGTIDTVPGYINDKAIKSLKDQIKKMIKDEKTFLPEFELTPSPFGVTSDKIKEFDFNQDGVKKKIYAPLYHKYQYQTYNHITSKIDILRYGLDDLTATLGSFSIMLFPMGLIYLEDENVALDDRKYRIELKQVGVYIKDAFNFNEERLIPQFLGFWNPKTNYAGGNPSKGVVITNESYNQWQEAHKKGMNFSFFSDVRYINVDATINNVEFN